MGLNGVTTALTLPPWQESEGFRALAAAAMSERFLEPLAPARLRGFPRPFDLASEDRTLLGLVLPPSGRSARGLTTLERAELSEAVLMLMLAPAQQRVLIVGYDAQRLLPWLATYGHLAQDIEFWHLRGPGRLERLHL